VDKLMAIYNSVNKINDHVKIASAGNFCIVCAKKLCAEKKISAYDAERELKGRIDNKKVLFVRTSGVDQCVCMDCIKDIYDEHIAPTLPTEYEGEAE
jgi:hypothetical protein